MDYGRNREIMSPGGPFSMSFRCYVFKGECMHIFTKQRRFIGTTKTIKRNNISIPYIDPLCLKTALPGLVKTYARPCLKIESDIIGSGAIYVSSKKLLKEIYTIRITLDALHVPPGLMGVQKFLIYIHHFFPVLHEKNEFF